MNNFEFGNPVKVVFGKGSIARLSDLIPTGSKVMMIYGGGSIKQNGVYEQVINALDSVDLIEFGGIEANPHYETCMQAVEVVKSQGIDFLLAVNPQDSFQNTQSFDSSRISKTLFYVVLHQTNSHKVSYLGQSSART